MRYTLLKSGTVGFKGISMTVLGRMTLVSRSKCVRHVCQGVRLVLGRNEVAFEVTEEHFIVDIRVDGTRNAVRVDGIAARLVEVLIARVIDAEGV